MAEITSAGFERENYSTLLNNIKQKFRLEFGSDVDLEDDSILGQFSALLAKLQNDNLKLLEALWASRKLQGAEGVYLDDIFGRMGVYRKAATAGEGKVLVEYDNTVPDNYVIPSTTTFLGTNGKTYTPKADTLVSSNVAAWKFSHDDYQTNTTYTLIITDTKDGQDYQAQFQVNDASDIPAVHINILVFIQSHLPDNFPYNFALEGNTAPYTAYLGYKNSSGGDTPDDEIADGMVKPTKIIMSPKIGVFNTSVDVECTEIGPSTLVADNISSMNPTFSGYLSVRNPNDFIEGNDVESDAQYRARYFQEINESRGGTRDSIIAELLSVEDVEKVRIYDNPTSSSTPEADPHSFNTIVFGGSGYDIAKTIYDNKPINTLTSGTTDVFIPTADDSYETVKFTICQEQALNVKITYSTQDNIPLTPSEQTSIVNNILDGVSTLGIGETLYSTKMGFYVLGASEANRLTFVKVETKLTTDPASLYKDEDKTPNFYSLYTIDEGDIIFVQTL